MKPTSEIRGRNPVKNSRQKCFKKKLVQNARRKTHRKLSLKTVVKKVSNLLMTIVTGLQRSAHTLGILLTMCPIYRVDKYFCQKYIWSLRAVPELLIQPLLSIFLTQTSYKSSRHLPLAILSILPALLPSSPKSCDCICHIGHILSRGHSEAIRAQYWANL